MRNVKLIGTCILFFLIALSFIGWAQPPKSKTESLAKQRISFSNAKKYIYKKNALWININQRSYVAIEKNIDKFLGNEGYITDNSCSSGRIKIKNNAAELFVDAMQKAGSIAPGVYFMWGNMVHGGMCLTGVIFNDNLDVYLVSTLALGSIGSTTSVLRIYRRDGNNTYFVQILKKWADYQTHRFHKSEPQYYGSFYKILVYDLDCIGSKQASDESQCIDDKGIHHIQE